MKNQVFQDDVRERKREEGKDIRDLHRCPREKIFAAICSFSSNAQFAELDFQACFGRMACYLLWKTTPFGSRPRPIVFKMTNNSLSKQRRVSKLSTTRPTTTLTTAATTTATFVCFLFLPVLFILQDYLQTMSTAT